MKNEKYIISSLEFHPLTSERWNDFEALFGERGACGGCWCMWWRIKRSEFNRQKGEGNKRSMKVIVEGGEIPGILAFYKDKPVAWCSVAPREKFPVLERSRILRPVDDLSVWSVVCFFIEKNYRKRGLSMQLLRAAVEFVKKQGGKVVEGYPVQPKKNPMPALFAWTGVYSAFKQAGFKECVRRSDTRPIMRYYIK